MLIKPCKALVLSMSLIILSQGAIIEAAIAAAPPNCFTIDDNRNLSFPVIQVGSGPRRVAGEYEFTSRAYPGTAFSSFQPAGFHAWDNQFDKYAMLWVNRCNTLPDRPPSPDCQRPVAHAKGNGSKVLDNKRDRNGNVILDENGKPIPIIGVPIFTTYEKANMCTKFQAMRLLGDDLKYIKRVASQPGHGDLIMADTSPENLRTLVPLVQNRTMPPVVLGGASTVWPYLIDVCILDTATLPDHGEGLLLDYEVWDYRAPSDMYKTIAHLSVIAHRRGKKLLTGFQAMPNPAVGTTDPRAVRGLLKYVDGMGIHTAWRGKTRDQAFADQVAYLTDNGTNPFSAEEKSKIFLNVMAGGATDSHGNVITDELKIADAQPLRSRVTDESYKGFMMVGTNGSGGGSCELPINQGRACMLLGDCSNRFRLPPT